MADNLHAEFEAAARDYGVSGLNVRLSAQYIRQLNQDDAARRAAQGPPFIQQEAPIENEALLQRSFEARQNEVRNNQLPLNIVECIQLAACEAIVPRSQRRATQKCQHILSRGNYLISLKSEEFRRQGMGQTSAMSEFVDICHRCHPAPDTRYFQVWEKRHPCHHGPKLIALNRERAKLLHMNDKTEIKSWPMVSLMHCIERGESNTVVLHFESEECLEFLSVEYAAIMENIRRLTTI